MYPMAPNSPKTVPPLSRRSLLITFGTGLLIILCLGGVFLAGGLGFVSLFSEPPLAVSASRPAPVGVGEVYDIALTVTNTGDRPIRFSEVQLPLLLLETSELTGTTPAYTTISELSGRNGYAFDFTLSPGASQTVTFHFKALYPGDTSTEARVMSGTRGKSVALLVRIEPSALTPLP